MCRRARVSKEGVLASAPASRFTAKGLTPDFTRVRFSTETSAWPRPRTQRGRAPVPDHDAVLG